MTDISHTGDVLEQTTGEKKNWLGAKIPLPPQFRGWVEKHIAKEDLSKKEENPHVTLVHVTKPDDLQDMIDYVFKGPSPLRLPDLKIAMKPYYIQLKHADVDVVCAAIQSEKVSRIKNELRQAYLTQEKQNERVPPPHMTLCYCNRPKDGAYPVKLRFSDSLFIPNEDVEATITFAKLNEILKQITQHEMVISGNAIYCADLLLKWTLMPSEYEPSPAVDTAVVLLLKHHDVLNYYQLEVAVVDANSSPRLGQSSILVTKFEAHGKNGTPKVVVLR